MVRHKRESRTIDGNTDIGLLESGGIVDTVTSHAHHVVASLQDGNNLVLVLGEHLGKAICRLHRQAELFLALGLLVL